MSSMQSPDQMAVLKCLECSSSMDRVEMNGHQIDVCTHCHALWLDPGEVQALTARKGFDLNRLERSLGSDPRSMVGLCCLRCRRDLRFVSNQGVAAGVCSCGGVFLSEDAVRQIEGRARGEKSANGFALHVVAEGAVQGVVEVAGHLAVGLLEALGEFLFESSI